MLYIVYLVSMVLYLVYGISWERMFLYYDPVTLELLMIPCILILFVTGSFRAFGRAFLFAFRKREYEIFQYQESLLSVKMVMRTSSVSGVICFLIGLVNSIRSLDWSEPDNIGWLFLDLSVAVLALFYALLICLILLPVYFMLKKQQLDRNCGYQPVVCALKKNHRRDCLPDGEQLCEDKKEQKTPSFGDLG